MFFILFFLLLLISGITIGIVSGVMGVGGGVLYIPLLEFAFDIPIDRVVGTSIVVVFVTSLSGAYFHSAAGHIHWETSKIFALWGGLGAVLGSLVFIEIRGLTVILEALMTVIFLQAARILARQGIGDITGKPPACPASFSRRKKMAVGFVVGILAGITGVGGGFLLLPIFICLLGLPGYVAVGSSLVSVVIISGVSSAFKIAGNGVDYVAVIALSVGSFAGTGFGTRYAKRFPDGWLKISFSVLLVFVAIGFVYEILQTIHF